MLDRCNNIPATLTILSQNLGHCGVRAVAVALQGYTVTVVDGNEIDAVTGLREFKSSCCVVLVLLACKVREELFGMKCVMTYAATQHK